MLKFRPLGFMLLASSALTAFPAQAQDVPRPTTGDQVAEPAVDDDNEDEDVDISAPGAGGFTNEIVVQGRYIPEPVKNTAQVVSVLSTEEIARAGDGNIAGALGRVTGLSVNTSGFVFVRGLGDRYSSALLNGLALPSPEPLRRVVPLDLFPTSVVSSAVVQKSYSVNYPGEFGGGVINLTTSSIPDENFLTVGVGISGDSETTGRFGYSHYGSDTDVIGYDDGVRSLDGTFGNVLNNGVSINTSNYTVEQLGALGKLVPVAPTAIIQGNSDIPANFTANMSAAYSTYWGDTKVGVIANAGFANNWRTRDAIQEVANGQDIIRYSDVVRTENRIVANGLLGLGVEFDSDNKIRFTNVYIHDTSKLSRRSGVYTDSGNDVTEIVGDPYRFLIGNTSFIERQLINTQVVGEFRIDDISISARGGYANSQRTDPFSWTIPYLLNSSDNSYIQEFGRQPPSISFSDLDEDVWNGAIDFAYELPFDFNASISAGYAYADTARTFTSRSLEFRDSGTPILNETVINFEVLPIQYLLSPGSIDYNELYLNETTIDSLGIQYLGDLTVHGGYVKLDTEFAQGLRLEAGVRYEDGDQRVTLVDFFGTSGGNFVQQIKNDYWLPAATLTWNFAEDFQARLHGSKTIARPQFRELAPIPYDDVESDRRFAGNPFLQDSELLNFEGRVEFYPDRGERMSIAGFYKEIDNPIESVSFVDDNGLNTTFANAPKAELYGGEVEMLKFFPLYNLGGEFWEEKRIVVSANYTYSESSISVGDGSTTTLFQAPNVALTRDASLVFRDGTPITGQSKHLVNLQLGFEDTERLESIMLLLTYASDRVSNRGPRNTGGAFDPDIIESPGVNLDVVLRQGFDISGVPFELKVQARNILGTDFSETQTGDGYVVRNNVYEVGTTFAASISTTF